MVFLRSLGSFTDAPDTLWVLVPAPSTCILPAHRPQAAWWGGRGTRQPQGSDPRLLPSLQLVSEVQRVSPLWM